ncbi:MAG TPA: hypothetical protein VN181_06400 [Thermoanaerobaculia bacterium]|nr:hypothetical protein [Thermoanaerobaculia bacterium]
MKLRYVIDGKEVTGSGAANQAALATCTVTCNIAGTEEDQELRGFHDEAAFQAWARTQHFASKLDESNALITKSREYETREHRRALDRQQAVNQRTLADMRELADSSGLSLSSKELAKLAHAGVSPLEPAILHSALLWDSSTASNLLFTLPSGVPIPTFGGANDRSSALTLLVGFVTLWDKIWWRGDKAYFVAAAATFALADVGFNNRAASGICV